MKQIIKPFIVLIFVALYLLTSVLSMINSLDFFKLSHSDTMSLYLAIAFEIGATASLCSLIILDKMNKFIVWALFITLTLFQIMSNTYNVYINLHDYQNWIELFGLVDEEIIYQKRILSIISGAILPLIALGFIKALMNYINPEENKPEPIIKEDSINNTEPNLIPFNKEVRAVENHIIESEPPVEPEVIVEPQPEEKKTEVIETLPTLPENNHESDDFEDDNFDNFLGEKKKKLESLKAPYLKLLMFLYKGGELIEGSELPGFNEYMEMIPKNEFTQKDIKQFLILCNYLGIFKVVETQKIALKSYGEAINKLSSYLSWN